MTPLNTVAFGGSSGASSSPSSGSSASSDVVERSDRRLSDDESGGESPNDGWKRARMSHPAQIDGRILTAKVPAQARPNRDPQS